MDIRAEILEHARQRLEGQEVPKAEIGPLYSLLDILLDSVEEIPEETERVEYIRRLANKIIDHRQLLLLLRQQTAEIEALKRISRNLTTSLELNQVLEGVVSEAMHLIKNAHDAHIFLYEGDKLYFGASLDNDGQRSEPFSEPRPEGLTYTVARQKKMIIVKDLRTHPLFENAPESWKGSIIGIPLIMGTRIVGVMNMARHEAGGFTNSEIRLLSMLADQAAIAIVNARLHRVTSQQALSDTLTGLPNRRALDEKLEAEVRRSLRTNNSFSVVMMDMDGFKVINDTFGHATGDVVLQKVFQALAKGIRTTDFLARYGGDELTLILPETDVNGAKLVASKIQSKLEQLDVRLPDGSRAALGLSGGIAVFPFHGKLASELMRAADAALYRAKKHARGTIQIARDATGPLPPIREK
jgi:diguanylate cyclase (GGDEF)-like protein